MTNTNTKSRRGVTLIELMVVFAMMGFLATVALPKFFDVAEKTREKVDLLKLYYLRDALNKALIEDLDSFNKYTTTKKADSKTTINNNIANGLSDQKRGATLFVIEVHSQLSVNIQGRHSKANNKYNISSAIGSSGTWYNALKEARFEGVADIVADRLNSNNYNLKSSTYNTTPYVNQSGNIDHRTAPKVPIFISRALNFGKENTNTRYTMSIHWTPGSEGYSVEVYLLPHKGDNPSIGDWKKAYKTDHGVCFSTLGRKGCQ